MFLNFLIQQRAQSAIIGNNKCIAIHDYTILFCNLSVNFIIPFQLLFYRGEKPQKVARHIALVHSRLDELLADKQLVEARRQELALKPNKVVIGEKCPVCDQQLNKQHSRVHVIWHFMDDLRDIVSAFPSNTVRTKHIIYSNLNVH